MHKNNIASIWDFSWLLHPSQSKFEDLDIEDITNPCKSSRIDAIILLTKVTSFWNSQYGILSKRRFLTWLDEQTNFSKSWIALHLIDTSLDSFIREMYELLHACCWCEVEAFVTKLWFTSLCVTLFSALPLRTFSSQSCSKYHFFLL